ncbi:unnamed protein product [Ilex paraguariensis]|uniref:Secreted protein n=1 Tax=Ilex paraguariensis TaxID=185542 RepID=A0ABC8UNQ5_9AQUA
MPFFRISQMIYLAGTVAVSGFETEEICYRQDVIFTVHSELLQKCVKKLLLQVYVYEILKLYRHKLPGTMAKASTTEIWLQHWRGEGQFSSKISCLPVEGKFCLV